MLQQCHKRTEWGRRLQSSPLSIHLLLKALRWAPAVRKRDIAALRLQRSLSPRRGGRAWTLHQHQAYQLVRRWPSAACPEAEKCLDFHLRRVARQSRMTQDVLPPAGLPPAVRDCLFAFLREKEPMYRMFAAWPAAAFVYETCLSSSRQEWANCQAWVVRLHIIPGKKAPHMTDWKLKADADVLKRLGFCRASLAEMLKDGYVSPESHNMEAEARDTPKFWRRATDSSAKEGNGVTWRLCRTTPPRKRVLNLVCPFSWDNVCGFLARWALNEFTSETIDASSFDKRRKNSYKVKAVYPPSIGRLMWSTGEAHKRVDQLNHVLSEKNMETMWTQLLRNNGVVAPNLTFKAMVSETSRKQKKQKKPRKKKVR